MGKKKKKPIMITINLIYIHVLFTESSRYSQNFKISNNCSMATSFSGVF